MNDLISRQAAIEAIERNAYRHTYVDQIVDIIRDVPPAQQEIIRCKDCKHSEHWYRDKRRCFLWVEDGIAVFDDGFCNYGERKEDATD